LTPKRLFSPGRSPYRERSPAIPAVFDPETAVFSREISL